MHPSAESCTLAASHCASVQSVCCIVNFGSPVQLDNANVPQPRADDGNWLQDGTTFRQRTDKECLVQHAFRRSLDESLRARKLNRTLSIQVEVPSVDAAGVDP